MGAWPCSSARTSKLADPAALGAPFDVLVADLSFIGLAQLAPVFARLSREGSVFLGLVKPQFESRPGEAEGGVVRDETVRGRVVEEVRAALEDAGFRTTGVVESPITGPEGNVEYLVRAVYGESALTGAPRTPHPAPRTPHPAPRTPHPAPLAPRTPHPAPRTPHPAPRTPHPAPRTPHPAPRTPHPAPRTPHPAPRTSRVHCL